MMNFPKERVFRILFFLFILLSIFPFSLSGLIIYNSTEDAIIVAGYKDASSKEPWTIEDVYQMSELRGWNKVHKYTSEGGNPLYVIESNLRVEGIAEIPDVYKIKIYNPNAYDLYDFQIKINLSKWGISERNFALCLDQDCTTEIPFCFEHDGGECDTNPSDVIWAKIPHLPANSYLTIYLFPSVSNHARPGNEVFILYDDFDDGIDNNVWYDPHSLNEKLNYNDRLNDYGIGFTGDANGRTHVRSLITFYRNIVIEARLWKNDLCSDHFIYISRNYGATWSWSSTSGVIRFVWNCDVKYIYGQSRSTSVGRPDEDIYDIRIIIKQGQVIFEDWKTFNPSDNNTLTLNDDIGDGFYIFIGADQDNTNYWSDWYWIRVRAYADYEPYVAEVEHIPGGLERVDPNYPNFVIEKATVWINKTFIVMPESYINIRSSTITVAKYYNVSWGEPYPETWRCIMFKGKANISVSTLKCELGAISFVENSYVSVENSTLIGQIEVASPYVSFKNTVLQAINSIEVYPEFYVIPSIENLIIKDYPYILSITNLPRVHITLSDIKLINVRNAWIFNNTEDTSIYLLNFDSSADPTKVVWIKGSSTDNTQIYYQYKMNIKVVDSYGNPVSDATIFVQDSKGNTYSITTDDRGIATLTLTVYKAIVSKEGPSQSDADQVLGPFDNGYYWHVYVYNPFSILVQKEGYEPYYIVYDLRQPSNVTFVLAEKIGVKGVVVRDIHEEPPSFVYAWVNNMKLLFPIRVVNTKNVPVTLTREELEENDLFIRLPIELKPYANLEHISVSEAVEKEELGVFTQTSETTWELHLENPRDFSCDISNGVINVFVTKLQIQTYSPSIKITLRAYDTNGNYFEEMRTLKEWYAWKSGTFYLMWPICLSNPVNSPDIHNIIHITIEIENPETAIVDTSSPSYRIKYVEIPKDRIFIIDKGSYLDLFWVDSNNLFTIVPNGERDFIISISPTPWLDKIQKYANILSFDPVILEYNRTASNSTFYYEVYNIYKEMLEYISVKSYKTSYDIKEYIEVNLTNEVNKILSELDQVFSNHTNIYNKLLQIQENITKVYTEVIDTKNLVSETNTSLYNKLLDLESTLVYIKQKVDYILGNLTQVVIPKLDTISNTANDIYTDTQYLKSQVDTHIIPRLDTILVLTQEINDTVHKINTSLIQHNQEVLSQISTLQTKLDTIQYYVDEVEDLLKCNSAPLNSVCDRLSKIEDSLNKINNTIKEIKNVLVDLDSYIRNDLTNRVDSVITKADQILANQTKIWDRLIELQKNITKVYSEVVHVENIVKEVNETLYNEVHTNRIYLESINSTVSSILEDIKLNVLPKLDQIKSDISYINNTLEIVRQQVDCSSNPSSFICTKLSEIESKVTTISNNLNELTLKIDAMNSTISEDLRDISSNITYLIDLVRSINTSNKNILDEINEINNTIWNSIIPTLNSISSDVGYVKTKSDEILSKVQSISSKVDQVLVELQKALDNQTKIYSELLTVKSKVEQVLSNVSQLESELLLVNQTLFSEVYSIKVRLEEINQSLYNEIEDLRTIILSKLDNIQSNITKLLSKVDEVKSLVDCSSNPSSPLCSKLDNIYNNLADVYSNTQLIINKVDNLQALTESEFNAVKSSITRLNESIKGLNETLVGYSNDIINRTEEIKKGVQNITAQLQEVLNITGYTKEMVEDIYTGNKTIKAKVTGGYVSGGGGGGGVAVVRVSKEPIKFKVERIEETDEEYVLSTYIKYEDLTPVQFVDVYLILDSREVFIGRYEVDRKAKIRIPKEYVKGDAILLRVVSEVGDEKYVRIPLVKKEHEKTTTGFSQYPVIRTVSQIVTHPLGLIGLALLVLWLFL